MALKIYRVGNLTYQYEEGNQPKGAVEVNPAAPAENPQAEGEDDKVPAESLPPAEPVSAAPGEQPTDGEDHQPEGEDQDGEGGEQGVEQDDDASGAEDPGNGDAKSADADNGSASADNKARKPKNK